MRSPLVLLALAAFSVPRAPLMAQAQQPAVTLVYGTLVGADGAPMRRADVELLPSLVPGHGSRAEVAPNGHFAIATTMRGLFFLRFDGVDHASATMSLVLPRPATVAMDVRLARMTYTDSLNRVAAVGDWNAFDPATAKPLLRQPDGRYSLEISTTADTLAYQLIGLEATEGGHELVDGPQAGWYVPDGSGNYRSIVRAVAGRAAIVLDPARLDRRPSELSVTFRDRASLAAREYALAHKWDGVRRVYFDTARARYQRHDTAGYDWAPIVSRRKAALARERNPVLRQLLLLQLLDAAQFGATIGRATAQRIVAEVRPSSPFWNDASIRTPWLIQQALELAGGETAYTDTGAAQATLAYFDSVVAQQRDSTLQTVALWGAIRLARHMKDARRANAYYTQLVTKYPHFPVTRLEESVMAPGRIWKVGTRAPEFQLASLDDSGVVYTPASFAGKVLLLDFWATWCGPCIAEMKYLREAHDSLAAQGLEMLSVSLDQNPGDVRRFRAGQWKMPWFNAYEPGGTDNAEMRRLEILALPTVVLVGRDGKVLSVNTGLRGDSLLPTLRSALQSTP
jgi:thiol-disulfide isomerase/thioredoxin